ncbi:hypothetical protein FK220_001080 [Flavobacteriaceae bacterium TP-CH-4]|uniref:HTH luxR-type domain-containing protein n=1 Tax=Pelagihabitans pacificus TaxID=2696054 RepID=A0A967E4V3_9FLAO|nr:hypothetical protein [Pelagihabitans pacificus]NHF57915.1 hypothetical protein [Pelagihabitans pacificus]
MILEYAITAIVCLITAVVIQRIYKREQLAGAASLGSKGILWFGWAIFVWGFGALLNLMVVVGLEGSPNNKLLTYAGVCISLLNSLFILLSLPSIEYKGKPNMIVRFVARFSEREFISIYLGIIAMLIFVFFAASYQNEAISNSFIWLIDIPISIIVAFALLHALNRAFSHRNMRFMYLPSLALFVLIVIAVTHRIVPANRIPTFIDDASWKVLGTVTAISFKFLFILLFSILLYSWKFLSEKEEKQSHLEVTLLEKRQLEKINRQLLLANESHLDTIVKLKDELNQITEASKIELSERQKEVLGNLAVWGAQKSYTEIAEAMHISVDGFQAHVHQIKKVLKISGSGGKGQLIQYAQENDLLRYSTLKPHS